MKRKTEDSAREALLESTLVIPISSERYWAGWEFLCRQVPGQEKAWLVCVEDLLRWGEKDLVKAEELLVARKYLLKDGKMVYGWLIRLKAKHAQSLVKLTESFVAVVKNRAHTVPAPVSQTQSQPQAQVAKTLRTNAPRIKVISRETDEEGKLVEITEMPLAHVRQDLNVPSKPIWSNEHGRYIGGGKGAKSTGGG